MGVSAAASRFIACGFVLIGGAGRAKGFGGPCAPALRRALAEGEGGGRTTLSVGGAAVGWAVAVSLSADSPSPSDCSLGICTLSRGLLASD